MFLLHGTSANNVPHIITEGLLPRKNKGNWLEEHHCPSIDNMIYLANNKPSAEFHGVRTSLLNKVDEFSIVTVSIENYTNLYPDENHFNTLNKIINKDDLKNMQVKVLENKSEYKTSLIKRGALCHKGQIKPKNIVEIKTKKISQSLYYNWIKNKNPKTIEEFDKSFNLIIHVMNNKYLLDIIRQQNKEIWIHPWLFEIFDTYIRYKQTKIELVCGQIWSIKT